MIWQGFEVCYVHTIAIHNYRVSKKTEVITNLQRQFVWSSELPYNKGDKKLPLTWQEFLFENAWLSSPGPGIVYLPLYAVHDYPVHG